MKIKNILMSLALASASTMGLNAAAYEDSGSATITKVYINTNGELLFQTTNHSFSSSLNCTNNGWYKINSSDTFVKEAMHKQLLTAKLTGNTVWLRATGCSYYPTVNIVSLNNN